ncbi:aldose epimerase family protein [Sphingobacterium sp. LRF_L2]|uniref:aldose epimerase family protein n=1 Tax=Sphingobacterium sp. LRF_L2 TaxID=3369421 RepID=UPI003F6137CE
MKKLNCWIDRILIFAVIAGLTLACTKQKTITMTKSGLLFENFKTLIHGDSTNLYVLRNSSGAEVCVTNYGARIVSIMMPDRNGEWKDVVLGFDSIAEYTSKPSSFGALIGRVANRIAYGKFLLDGDTVHLDVNSVPHTIHGGQGGWQTQVFDVEQASDSVLVLRYKAPDGENGFPGEMNVEVTYKLTADNILDLAYQATTNKKTIANLTNHSFFNLSGNPKTKIINHVLTVNADAITPLDEVLITTGEQQPVDHSPFDFRNAARVGDALKDIGSNAQLQIAKGIDHNYVLNSKKDTMAFAAKLYAPETGISMEVYTDEPGLQVYTGNMLDGSRRGKGGIIYDSQSAICLEPQHFPDTPNKADWPPIFISPGEVYTSHSSYKFTVEK